MKELEKIVKQLEYFKQDGNCWKWTGRIDTSGYAVVNVHRLMYELFNGKITKGLVIDHLCRERCCFNPDHLEAVTAHENKVRAGFLIPKHKRLTIEYFKKEIEIQDLQYRNSLSKLDKKQYQKKRVVNDEMIMEKFRETFNF